jgi:serine/threonine protein kinase
MADLGNLKDFLRRGGFSLTDGQRDMAAIVSTALDIARAMVHLHTECIIHSDLKVSDPCWGLGVAVA